MSNYKHILVAVNLHGDCDKIVMSRATEMAKANNAKLSVVHAVEHINAYGVAEAYAAVVDVEAQLMDDARKEMGQLGKQFNISPENEHLEVGSPKSVILGKVEELQADLIVLGSHGRHGFQLLLGSTATSVLHHAGCDILAVRVRDED